MRADRGLEPSAGESPGSPAPGAAPPMGRAGLDAITPLVISAPFGNYVQPAGATATVGTFTAHPRPGRLWRIVRTLRYSLPLRAWVNRIGLRNPGIEWLRDRVRAGRVDLCEKILSIHGFDADEWWRLLEVVAELRPRAVELNISCPNVGEMTWPADLFERAAACGVPVLVKLPPVRYRAIAEQARAAGIAGFHCCNTLPVPAGGLSGPPLQPVALECVRDLLVRDPRPQELFIIGGGGIVRPADVDRFFDAGARRVAVATLFLHPRGLVGGGRAVRDLLARARERSGAVLR